MYFKDCPSCTNNEDYNLQLIKKENRIKELFSDIYSDKFEVFASRDKNFRNRVEFGIFHKDDDIFYTLVTKDKKRVFIKSCEIVDKKISFYMQKLFEILKNSNSLKQKLFGVEFISSKVDFMIVLLYHKDIEIIKDELLNLKNMLGVKLITRSRKKIIDFDDNELVEILKIDDKEYKFILCDNAFIQPNRYMNEIMISWVKKNLFSCKDYLEMYCGHGNFTLPLSDKFNKVLASEISKRSIQNAKKSLELNGIKNIKLLRISSEDLMDAFAKKREFKRLKDINLDEFNFSHILVDPPRAGLDESVINFIKNYEFIIYISCNPLTLKRDIEKIIKTHTILKFAIFDQFVNTDHIECGILLQRIKK